MACQVQVPVQLRATVGYCQLLLPAPHGTPLQNMPSLQLLLPLALDFHPPMMDTPARDTPMGYTSLSNSSSGSVELVEAAAAAAARPVAVGLVRLRMDGVRGSEREEGNQSCGGGTAGGQQAGRRVQD
jgi:hypothetical protein